MIAANRWTYGVPEEPVKLTEVSKTCVAVEIPDISSSSVEAAEMEPETSCIGSVEEMIQVACEYYGIDYKIPLAIAKLETGHFTSEAYHECNNVGGMSIDDEPIAYSSLTDGVDAFVKNLSDNYFAEGLDTPEAIGEKYCPANAENWAAAVRGLM